MKIVFLSHAVRGNEQENLADIRRIVRLINLTEDNIIPFVPYYADVVSLDEADPAERMRGMANAITIIRAGIVDELWLTGMVLTPGMEEEMNVAKECRIKIVDKIRKL